MTRESVGLSNLTQEIELARAIAAESGIAEGDSRLLFSASYHGTGLAVYRIAWGPGKTISPHAKE